MLLAVLAARSSMRSSTLALAIRDHMPALGGNGVSAAMLLALSRRTSLHPHP